MIASSLRALLKRTFDYAGLFPPADLELSAALQNHSQYVRLDDVWMLGAFIIPAAKLEAVSANLTGFDVEHLLRLSALGAKCDSISELPAAIAKMKEAIAGFNSRHGASAAVEQIEMPIPPGITPDHLEEIATLLRDFSLPIFCETPADDAERMIALIADHRTGGSSVNFGYKLRTGGVVASAFPSCIQVARALVAAAKTRVPIKFTAGLHHPIRQFHQSVATDMHGFLNVFGAAFLAEEHAWDVVQTAAMLEEIDPAKFHFDDDKLEWREWSVSTDRVREMRARVTSLGTCSFDEPRDDLRALGFL